MSDLQRHSDEDGWIQEGIILYYETPSLQSAKVFAGSRQGQELVLPKDENIEVVLGNCLLLKIRFKNRCFFGKAAVISIQENTFTVKLPDNYQSLPRKCFYRVELSRSGRFNEEDVCVKDISVSGAAIEVSCSDRLKVDERYRFQLGRFSTFATINEISGNLVRAQFSIRDNLSQELNRLVRDSYRLKKAREMEQMEGMCKTVMRCSVS